MTVAAAPSTGGVARDAATITGLNLVSRLTGFARVVAMAAALGTTSLGDTYQSANLVSNILFELLAGGILSAVLVPAFVARLAGGDRNGARALAGVLMVRAGAGLAAVVAVAVAASGLVMRLLTLGVTDAEVRDDQVRLGTFLLLFFLPQILLYAVGAVTTALLQADRRFVAAALAPACNNLVVIATMVAFRAVTDGDTSLDPGLGPSLVLAVGTTLGVVAMTALPLVASARGNLAPVPGWRTTEPLGGLVRSGAWAAGYLGVNQVLAAVTIVFAARVAGGVVAYQLAFTFFLLPHAVLAHPIATALYPRLAEQAASHRPDDFAADLGRGLRATALLVLPAGALLGALAGPILGVVRVGNLDASGADFVGRVVATYCIGLCGYAVFHLLTRASYALDDARSPTIVNGVGLVVGVAVMAVGAAFTEGVAAVAILGVAHAVAVTGAAVALFRRVRTRLDRAIPCLATLVRAAVLALVTAVVARLVSDRVADALDGSGRTEALAVLAVGGLAGAIVYLAGQALAGEPELQHPARLLRRST